MNIKDIKELILTVDKTSIQRVDIETKDGKVSISKGANQERSYDEVESMEIKPEKQMENVEEKITEAEEDVCVVRSPIVGVFYESPSPGAKPFVKAGDNVEKGQTLCIIEAMKIMNEIESEFSGEVVEIMVKNEEPVEYGQPLMKIRR